MTHVSEKLSSYAKIILTQRAAQRSPSSSTSSIPRHSSPVKSKTMNAYKKFNYMRNNYFKR